MKKIYFLLVLIMIAVIAFGVSRWTGNKTVTSLDVPENDFFSSEKVYLLVDGDIVAVDLITKEQSKITVTGDIKYLYENEHAVDSLLFARNQKERMQDSGDPGGTDLWQINLKTKEERLIEADTIVHRPVINPKNIDQVAFWASSFDIYIWDNGSLFKISDNGVVPHWQSDGTRILFSQQDFYEDPAEPIDNCLAVYDVTTQAVTCLVDNTLVYEIRMSPDGRKILWVGPQSSTTGGVSAFWLFDVSSNILTQLTNKEVQNANSPDFVDTACGTLMWFPLSQGFVYNTCNGAATSIVSVRLNNQKDGVQKIDRLLDDGKLMWSSTGRIIGYDLKENRFSLIQ